MMLQALYQLAHDEGLMADPDYEPKPVAWLVRVGEGGKLLGIEGTHFTPPVEGKRKPKPVAKRFLVPRQPTRTSGDLAFFLCDKSEYVFGQSAPMDTGTARDPAKLVTRRGLFQHQVRACLDATRDAGVAAVHSFLEAVEYRRVAITLPETCAPNDLFAFAYKADGGQLVHLRPLVRSYWAQQRSTHVGDTAEQTCLVTGAPMAEAGLFPLLKKVPGGTTSGVSLVSFNANAFESYGWSSNANAPISRGAAEACATALNRLLDPAYPDPANPESPLPRRQLRIGDDTVVCFWARGRKSAGFVDVLADLLEAQDPLKVGDLYRAIWHGRMVEVGDPSAFYALTLTGTQGRAVVRDWFETTVGEVAQHLVQHFADLTVCRNTPPPKGRELAPVAALPALLRALAPLGDDKGIPDALATQFIGAGLRGQSYPLSLLSRAVERMRSEIGHSEWADLDRRDARVALIKAVLNRTCHVTPEIQAMLDLSNRQPAYLLGRLLAVIERLQQEGLPDVNASVIDRYFAAASATPRVVFTRLVKAVPHYVKKAQDEPARRGFAIMLDRLVSELLSYLPAEARKPYPASAAGFPAALSVQDQGIFILGYHQQRHWLWLSKDERERLTALQPASV